MKIVVTLNCADNEPQRINLHLAEQTPGALKGLALFAEPVDVQFSRPMIVLGARIEGVNS